MAAWFNSRLFLVYNSKTSSQILYSQTHLKNSIAGSNGTLVLKFKKWQRNWLKLHVNTWHHITPCSTGLNYTWTSVAKYKSNFFPWIGCNDLKQLIKGSRPIPYSITSNNLELFPFFWMTFAIATVSCFRTKLSTQILWQETKQIRLSVDRKSGLFCLTVKYIFS